MRFFRRHIHAFLFFAVLALSSVMVVRQFLLNQSAHVQAREDFMALQQKGHHQIAEHRYQLLIHALPKLSESVLWDDLQRTLMVVDTKTPQVDNLIWKYQVSVRNELNKRIDLRVERALERAQKR